MIPSELYDAFRLEVDDDAAPFLWSEDEIYNYMDKAQRAFARATDCFLDATTASVTQVTVTADSSLATLSPLVTKVRRAELLSTRRVVTVTTLAAMDEGQITGRDYGLTVPWQWRTATGEPLFAITDYQPGKLLLAPIPVTADTLSLTVYRMPLNKITVASSAFEVVDEDHQFGLMLYMQHRAYLKQDAETYNPKRSKAAQDEWLEFIDGAKGSFRRQRFTPTPIAYGGISKPVTFGPWPKGMDNVSVDHAVAKDALRTAVNTDVLDDGTLRRRAGLTARISGAAHSAWSDGQALYAVVGGVLTRYVKGVTGALTGTALRTGMSPDLPLAYETVGSDMFYSNGAVSGKIVSGAHRAWGVERPSGQPVLAALGSGALYAGRYQVAVTFVDNLGEESGTAPLAAVSVAVGGGIQLTVIPQPVDATVSRIRIYVSEANGDVLYRYGDYAAGTTSSTIARSSTLGQVLSTQFLLPPVPGHILKAFNGRMYIGRSNLVYFTEPGRYGAMKQTNYMAFEDEVRLIEDGGKAGLWVATAARTYILQGKDPADFELIEKLAYGAPRSTAVELPGGRLFWMSTQAPVVVNLQGEIEDLTDDEGEPLARIAVDNHLRSSAVVRDQNGVRQVIAAVGGGIDSELDSQDFFDIEIIRKT